CSTDVPISWRERRSGLRRRRRREGHKGSVQGAGCRVQGAGCKTRSRPGLQPRQGEENRMWSVVKSLAVVIAGSAIMAVPVFAQVKTDAGAVEGTTNADGVR